MMYVFPAAECPDPAIRVTVLYNVAQELPARQG